jgi:hypothetical protein
VAGYSGTPLAQKLGIKEGHRLRFVDAPASFEPSLAPMPSGTKPAGKGEADLVVAFHKSRGELGRALPKMMERLHPDGSLWVAWPKKASGIPTDVTEDVVRELALPLGLVDNKVCAIDETWSGLKLVLRLENRPLRRGAAKK